jgi:hypothetical protein
MKAHFANANASMARWARSVGVEAVDALAYARSANAEGRKRIDHRAILAR